MGWFTALVLFTLIWWTTLFAVLPLWTRPDPRPDARTGWRGAPERARIGRKLVVTTAVAAVLWAACAAVIESGWISFREAARAMPDD